MHRTPLTLAFSLSLPLLLTACDNIPFLQDKYPTANIPDKPLDKPLDIIIEPKKVAMTNSWAAGIKEDGTLWTWGEGEGIPAHFENINDAVAISGGGSHMLLLRKDGTVWGWGGNYHGKIDPNDKKTGIYKPRKIEGLTDIVDVVAGETDSMFVTKTGEVYVMGGMTLG